MEQSRVIIAAILSASLRYAVNKVVAATVLIIELTFALALSSKIVPVVSAALNRLRRTTPPAIHQQQNYATKIMSTMMMAISKNSDVDNVVSSRTGNGSSRNSTTCYAGGGEKRSVGEF